MTVAIEAGIRDNRTLQPVAVLSGWPANSLTRGIRMHILQRRRFISLVLAALAALAIPAMPAAADNPRSITVMTQNIYQGTELEHVVTATTPLQYIQARDHGWESGHGVSSH